ncbi:MAG: hypothetical protein J6X02_00070 [Bacilli bacterium]|nr:hypothetical protein [Bacilli bacterium]
MDKKIDKEINQSKSTKAKVITVMLGLSFFCIFSFLLLIIFDKGFLTGNEVLNKNNKSKEQEKTYNYRIIYGEQFNVYGREDEDEVEPNLRDWKISFMYPMFDIDSDDARKANEDIKKLYDEAYALNMEHEYSKDGCIAIKKDDKYYGGSHIYSYSFDISENDRFIAITLINEVSTECAGGYNYYKSYVIDKTTKNKMTNSQLVKYYNLDESKIIEAYNEGSTIFDYDPIKSIDDARVAVYKDKLYVVKIGNGETIEEIK